MKEQLENIILKALEACFDNGTLRRVTLPDFVVEIPKNPDHGHFASNVPMTLASSQKRAPRKIAEALLGPLKENEDFLEKVEIAGPGFLNFVIRPRQWYQILARVLSEQEAFGRTDKGKGERILFEYVSANPTGPLHLGHGRGAALGDSLCRILAFCGYDITREFYINDAGQQMRLLGESIYSRFRQKEDPGYPFPEQGYLGNYIDDLARAVAESKELDGLLEDEAVERCTTFGRKRMLEEIRGDLEAFGAGFDVWTSESDIVGKGLVEESIDNIKSRGELFEKDGAWWIRTTDHGDDKDRVIRKQDGQLTYFATDIAYHMEKWKRGFSKAVNIWGADHHGYVKRVKAALMANGLDEDWLSVILIQLVKLWEHGEELRMSKRAGTYVTLQELMDQVGVDAARFIFLTKSHDSPLDFDLDLAKKQDSDNPVYYVQYAHARICSVFRKAQEEGVPFPGEPEAVLDRLVLDEEMALIRFLARFPDLLAEVCESLEPHRVTYYLTELASIFHRYFNLGTKEPEKRIVTADIPLSQARLCLIQGIRTVIKNGLGLLGVGAPERM